MSFVSDIRSSPASEDDTYILLDAGVDAVQPSSAVETSSSVSLVEAYMFDGALDDVNAAEGMSPASLETSLDTSLNCPAGAENSSSLVVAYSMDRSDCSDSASDKCPAGAEKSSSLVVA